MGARQVLEPRELETSSSAGRMFLNEHKTFNLQQEQCVEVQIG